MTIRAETIGDQESPLGKSNRPPPPVSNIEPEVDDVAVGDDVLLALQAELADLADLGLGLEGQQIIDAHHLRTDEAALDVRVDLAGGAVRGGALADRPGAALVGPRGQK